MLAARGEQTASWSGDARFVTVENEEQERRSGACPRIAAGKGMILDGMIAAGHRHLPQVCPGKRPGKGRHGRGAGCA